MRQRLSVIGLPALLCTLLLSTLLWPGQYAVQAHQQKAAVTRVLFNTRSGNLEVMHRFYLHDAEHAMRQRLDPTADIIGSEESREQFARYVTERFALLGEDGNTLPLRYVGQELDDMFLWVYQELPLPEDMSGLSVVHNVLREVWPEQNNLVNIERKGEVQTLNFNGSTEWLSVSFDP